jgi:hypothetical protein
MNKAQIRVQLLALLNRNDCSDAQADIFIEQAMSRIQRTLRIPPMERQETITANDVNPGLITLPDDFLNIKYLFTTTGMLQYRDLATFIMIAPTVGIPAYYTRIQGGLNLKPFPPEGYTVNMIYYGEIPDLVTDTDENFLTIIAADLLIYAALTFASDFFVDERKPAFEAKYSTIYLEVEEQARLSEMDQATLAIQPVYQTDY